MIRFASFAAAAIVTLHLSSTALWQQAHSHQPYAELMTRSVKALSDQQIADLRAGRGMGLALAAELNGYPGPRHALEHAEALGLSPSQRERTQKLFRAMEAETIRLGEQLIQRETELDRLFAEGTITVASLDETTSVIGVTQGALRAAHLRYHLEMARVLTPQQMQRYSAIRGYEPIQEENGAGDESTGAQHRHSE